LNNSFGVVLAGFAITVLAFVSDRACADELNLLPATAINPPLAAVTAVAYLAGYAWLLAAYALAVSHTGVLLPGFASVSATVGTVWRPAILAAFAMIDYLPAPLVRVAARLVDACGAG
jgi:hypothetical protein